MSVYNTRSQLYIYLYSSLLWLIHSGRSCIFSNTHGYKAQASYVTFSQNVTNFKGDCEFLCYRNSSCVAGNVIRQSDGSYMCQFVSLSLPSNYINLLESNPAGKYFSSNDILGKYIITKTQWSDEICIM